MYWNFCTNVVVVERQLNLTMRYNEETLFNLYRTLNLIEPRKNRKKVKKTGKRNKRGRNEGERRKKRGRMEGETREIGGRNERETRKKRGKMGEKSKKKEKNREK